ncbi:MAG: Maf family protein [Betaproteobacteria bacterium]
MPRPASHHLHPVTVRVEPSDFAQDRPVQAPHSFIWLASQSPRRQALLAQIGVTHQPLLPGEDEDAEALEAEWPGELPLAYVQRVTRAKLQAAVARHRRRGLPPAPILCADTTVALGRRILGKPAEARDAAAMLSALSGRTHRVLTSVAVACVKGPGGRFRSEQATHVSRVRFAPLSAAMIEAYIASGEPFGKAGSYGIQGALATHIAHIEGSHSGIMGLPLHETAGLLRRAGAQMALSDWAPGRARR